MTQHPTMEKMQQMKLTGMLRAFKQTMETNFTNNLTVDELIAYLIDAEWEERHNRKLNRLLNNAHFRYRASIEQIDFTQPRELDKNLFLRLSDCEWLRKADNVLITGATGTGKSFIASTLGHQACTEGFRVIYFNSLKLFSKLKFAKADGTYDRELRKIKKQNLLILDDFGLHPIDEQSKLMLLELLEDRYGVSSTLIVSQFPVKSWYEIINNPTVADAILDRIVHNSHQIELKGESMRKTLKNSSG